MIRKDRPSTPCERAVTAALTVLSRDDRARVALVLLGERERDTLDAVAGDAGAGERAGAWRALAGLVGEANRRARALDELAVDELLGEQAGALVEPGDDPVGDALDELRRDGRSGELP